MEAAGYKLPRLVMSATNQWRYDNDPPFPALAEFVAEWNRLKLTPALRFTTASVALTELEKISGASLLTYEGEWTDYWANGTAVRPARGGGEPAGEAVPACRAVRGVGSDDGVGEKARG